MTGLFQAPSAWLAGELRRAGRAIGLAFPLKKRHREELPYAVRDLSRLLTSERDLKKAYWASPRLLGAYLHYFLPWNLLRLSWLLPGLPLDLAAGDRILDLGSGPLTLPLGLWLARPELRALPLDLAASDLAPRPLELGREILRALAAGSGQDEGGTAPGNPPRDSRSPHNHLMPWKVSLLRSSIENAVRAAGRRESGKGLRDGRPESARAGRRLRLILAGNVLNELPVQRQASLEESLGRLFAALDRGLAPGGQMFFMEPGTRLGGKLAALMRRQALAAGYEVQSPCTHPGSCPYLPEAKFAGDDDRPELDCAGREEAISGARPASCTRHAGWCHFSHSELGADPALLKLSAQAELEKEKLHISFVLLRKPDSAETSEGGSARKRKAGQEPALPCRVVSERIRLSGQDGAARSGRYLCTPLGLGLATGGTGLASGDLAQARPGESKDRDPKTGALLFDLEPASKKEAPVK